MYDYISQYKSEIKRVYNNCAVNDPRKYTKEHIDTLYGLALINYKEWSLLVKFADKYIDNTLK